MSSKDSTVESHDKMPHPLPAQTPTHEEVAAANAAYESPDFAESGQQMAAIAGEGDLTWGYAESLVMLTSVDQLNHQLTEAYEEHLQQEAPNVYMAEMGGSGIPDYVLNSDMRDAYSNNYVQEGMKDYQPCTMFERVYGNDLKFMSVGATDTAWGNAGNYPVNQTVILYANAFGAGGYGGGNFAAVQNAIHELGHAFERRVGHPEETGVRVPRNTLDECQNAANQYWPGKRERDHAPATTCASAPPKAASS